MHLVPGCPAHVLLPLRVLFYDMFERINNQSINGLLSQVISAVTILSKIEGQQQMHILGCCTRLVVQQVHLQIAEV